MGSIFEIMNSPNTYRVQKAEHYYRTTTQSASNVKQAAQANLANFTRTIGNSRRLEAAGKEYNAQVANLAKALDVSINTDMNLVMAAAQTQGSLMAQAAAAGVGGSSVDLLDHTTQLQTEMQREYNESERDSLAIFGTRANTDIMDNAWQQIDMSQTFGNYDRSVHIAPKKLKNRWGAMIAVGVATYFGGPQAGQATADVIMASHKANNGKFDEASQYYSNAFRNAAGAMEDWRGVQDNSGKSRSWFNAVIDRNTQSQKALEKAQDNSAKQARTGGAFGGWFG